MTFSRNPQWSQIPKTQSLRQRFYRLTRSSWPENTDFAAAIRLILNTAKAANTPAEDMPRVLLVLSDMQFDQTGSLTGYQDLQLQYTAAGYECPKIVFWNLAAREGGIPVTQHTSGVVLVSGYSPAALTAATTGEFSPVGYMMERVEKEYVS